MNERTYTQEELNETIARALKENRAETAQAVEKATREGAENATDYRAQYEALKAELDKLKLEQAAAIAEHQTQEKRQAIIRAFFSGDSERAFRHDAEAVAQVLEWFPDVDKYADVDEARKAAFHLKMTAPGIMQEIRGSKKKKRGLFRKGDK